MVSSEVKLRGFVVTPQPVASFLVNWAVRNPHDVVLDLGVGEGVFLLEAYHRLLQCGAHPTDAPVQLIGTEADTKRYHTTAQFLQSKIGVIPPLFLHSDFFASDLELPLVDVIVGNPPYVRRSNLGDIQKLRERLLHSNLSCVKPTSLSDLYIYFVLHSLGYLKSGGRVALVLPASWLDVGYGMPLKQILLSTFKIQGIILLESRIFRHVLVRPVLLLAEKAEAKTGHKVRFLRFHGEVANTHLLMRAFDNRSQSHCQVMQLSQENLDPQKPWGVYLKTPAVYQDLVERGDLIPLGELAKSRIGIQTLAKRFYILSSEEITRHNIAAKNVKPIVLSPRDLRKAVIELPEEVSNYILFVDQAKEKLDDLAVKEYVEEGEKTIVPIRGKSTTVIGYQNVPRIQQAKRRPWYNLKTDIQRRGCYPILLPRRFYERFVVVWNKAGIVANENFIELKPHQHADLLPLLAILNSSVFELFARSHAQLYGGGVYNLNPANVPTLPVLDIRTLPRLVKDRLSETVRHYLYTPNEQQKDELDTVVLKYAMGLEDSSRAVIQKAVLELKKISLSAKA